MKRFVALAILLVSFSSLNAQQYHLEGGIGLGSIPNADNNQGKGMLYLGAYRSISEQLSFGLELSSGGRLFAGENNTFEGRTEILDPNDTKWSSALLKGRYYVLSGNSPVYAGLGIGINSYWRNVHAQDNRTISQINLAIAPEVGIEIGDNLSLSLRYLVGGNTKAFEGTKELDPTTNLRVERINIGLVLFSVGYRLSF